MYTLTVSSRFSAAHHLINYPGPCQRIHGHNYRVKISITATRLDDMGMVMDLMDLQSLLDKCVGQFDHQYLNKIPPFDALNPTSENFSRYIFEWIEQKLPEHITLKTVEFFETEDYSVKYEKS
jgi:6-pyruvoyltetrahydropterin/6-carboxytetrahydropterin synthase